MGSESRVSIRVDTTTPMISIPVPVSSIVTEPRIRWDWKPLFIPPSGIPVYLVTVEAWRKESSESIYPVVDVPVAVDHFVLEDGIMDGYMYRISVKAVSGGGKIVEETSGVDVLLDLTPPSKPTGLVLSQKEYGSREYELSWYPSMENTEGGVACYEIWWKVEGGDWSIVDMVEGTNTTLERPLERSFEVKVRAMDLSLHYSDFSKVVALDNQGPVPLILLNGTIVAGRPLNFHTQDIIDPDGMISSFQWSLDGVVLSTLDHLDITLGPGSYELILLVFDDQGAVGNYVMVIEVPDPSDTNLNNTVTGWLEDTSLVTIDNPPVDVPHYNNETVYIKKNETGGGGSVLKEFLMNSMLLMTAIPLVIVVVMIVLYLFVGEIMGLRSERMEFVHSEREEDDIIEVRKEELRSFMERQVVGISEARTPKVEISEEAIDGMEEVSPGIYGMIRSSFLGKALGALDDAIEEEEWEEDEWEETDLDEDFVEWEEVEE